MKYSQLTQKQKQLVINQVAEATNYHPDIIEKDWWVTQVLRAVFSLP